MLSACLYGAAGAGLEWSIRGQVEGVGRGKSVVMLEGNLRSVAGRVPNLDKAPSLCRIEMHLFFLCTS